MTVVVTTKRILAGALFAAVLALGALGAYHVYTLDQWFHQEVAKTDKGVPVTREMLLDALLVEKFGQKPPVPTPPAPSPEPK